MTSKAQPNAPTLELAVTSAIHSALEDKSDNTRSDTHNGEEDPTFNLSDNLEWMAFTSNDQFLGMSSGAMLLRTGFKLKNEYMRDVGRVNANDPPKTQNIRSEFRSINPVHLALRLSLPLLIFYSSRNPHPNQLHCRSMTSQTWVSPLFPPLQPPPPASPPPHL